jgi:tartrate-resistant acid phosphatase type 5
VRRAGRLLAAALPAAMLALACRSGGGSGARPPAPGPSPSFSSSAARFQAGPRFFAVGDQGTGSPDQHQVGRAIRDKCRAAGCDFGVLLGDNFYPDGVTSADDPQWKAKFEDPYAELLAMGVPFYPVLGNHDYADGADFSRGEHQVAYGITHPLWRMPAAHHVFEHGNVLFAALDTMRLDAGPREAEDEQQGLVEAASGSGPRWVVALGHHPYASNGQNGDAHRRLARFLEREVCGQADVYLSAHDHNLQVLPPLPSCNTLQVIAGGGGYATYTLPGSHPALFQQQTLGFAYVAVEGNHLRLEMIAPDGTVLFRHEVVK